MADKQKTKNPADELKIERLLQRLWLTYYNDTLFEKGLITEEERNIMRVKIKKCTSFMEQC